jgi:N-acetylmuramoyl-L-alanine amidase
MKISGHKLTPDFAEISEVNKTSGDFKRNLPDTIVIHYTAGSSAMSAINTFKDPSVKASAHVIVDTDGKLTQMVPFHKIAWHAGKSSWLDRKGLNQYSIGIEIVNAGRLEKCGDKLRSWFGKTFQVEDALEAVHHNESEPSWWHCYTEEQISAVFELCKTIMDTYQIRYILGHDEISPGRKSDPGPAFPMEKLRERLIHNNRKDEVETESKIPEKGFVNTKGLNIRSGPGVNHKPIAEPLSRNTELTILDEKEGWYQAEVTISGWVSKRYIKLVKDS